MAQQRGQVVSAERRGDVVRVVLRGDVVRRPAQPTTTDSRQDHDKPRQLSAGRLAVIGASVGGGISVGIGLCWAGRQAAAWVGHNWALLLGAAVVLLIIAAILTWATVGGGDKHPCNR